jgi:hypothetical protein
LGFSQPTVCMITCGINFYRKFIPHFSQSAKPLHHLANQSTFHWTLVAEENFQCLKEALCSAHILCFPDLQQPFEIEIDASQHVIGEVLKQGGHPIAYHYDTLSQAKQHYSTYDKEFYILVEALKKWHHYIFGKETILHIDHRPFIFINS